MVSSVVAVVLMLGLPVVMGLYIMSDMEEWTGVHAVRHDLETTRKVCACEPPLKSDGSHCDILLTRVAAQGGIVWRCDVTFNDLRNEGLEMRS